MTTSIVLVATGYSDEHAQTGYHWNDTSDSPNKRKWMLSLVEEVSAWKPCLTFHHCKSGSSLLVAGALFLVPCSGFVSCRFASEVEYCSRLATIDPRCFLWNVVVPTCPKTNATVSLVRVFSDPRVRGHLRNVYSCLAFSTLVAAGGALMHFYTSLFQVSR